MAAINRADAPVHPEDARISGCRHVVFYEDAPGGTRNATAIEPGWLDRSPCGTGTSARMAALHARGELALGEDFVNESVIGTRFTGRLIEETTVGGLAGRGARDHRPRVGDGDGPVPARPERPVPGGLRAVSSPDVVVLGAGIVGACAALELARGGARVEVIERGGGWGESCSWGNAGLLVPSHARPIAAPESLRAGLRWMVKPDSPFGLKLKPSLAPWLARYLRASTAARARDGEALQRELARESIGAFRELAAEGIDGGFDEPGCLTVHTSADADEHAAAEAASETGRALGAQVLTGDEARQLEPSLTSRVRAAVLFPDEARCDPVRLAAAVGAAATERGVRLRTGVEAYAVGGDGIVETTHGPVRAGTVVVAAGAWSGRLARSAGVRLPLQGGKGYAAEWDPSSAPVRMPLYLHDQRVVANPMGDRTRMTGGLLLDGLDETYDHRRVRAIASAAEEVLGVRARPRLTWRGLRPCTPDGLPVIGAHRDAPHVIFATGHGMLGVTLAPLTGRLVASVVAGAATHPALARLSPERF